MIKKLIFISSLIFILYLVVEYDGNASIKNNLNTKGKTIQIVDFYLDDFKFNFDLDHVVYKIYNIVPNIKSTLFTSNAINIVKSGRIDDSLTIIDDGLTIEEWVSRLVGVRGSLNWKDVYLADHDDRIKAVLLDMVREDGKHAKIIWVVNIDTKLSEIEYVEINGEAKPASQGAVEFNF